VSGNDIEIVTFANELQSTLQRAGWVVKRITAITTSAVVGMGILVSDGCGEQIESIAKAIANVFLSNGIATGVAKTRNPNRTADQSIRISVGQKPPNTPVA
jgi:hypothetical protein